MKMEVRLFGMIAEKAGSKKIDIEGTDTDELIAALKQRIPELSSISYAMAVDRRIVKSKVELAGTEEIALLPPFAGG